MIMNFLSSNGIGTNIGWILINMASYLFRIFNFLILIRCIFSWIPNAGGSIANLVYTLTNPIINPFTKLLNKTPLGRLPVNFSPVLAIIVMQFAYRLFLMAVSTILL